MPDRAFDGAALLVSVPQGEDRRRHSRADQGRRFGALATLVGSHATRYTGGTAAEPLIPNSGHRLPNHRCPAIEPGRIDVRTRAFAAIGPAWRSRNDDELEMSVSERPQPRPGVLKIQAYVPGKSSAPGVAKVFKLSSNETPLGAEPAGDRGLRALAPAS